MKRTALYSSTARSRVVETNDPPALDTAALAEPSPRFLRLKKFARVYRLPLLVLAGVLAVFSGALLERQLAEPQALIT